MNFSLLQQATSEMIAAALWYEERRPGLGEEFVQAVEVGFTAIRANPDSLPALEGYRGPHSIRRHLLKRFPYAIIFMIRENVIVVVAVAHTRRRPFYWRTRMD